MKNILLFHILSSFTTRMILSAEYLLKLAFKRVNEFRKAIIKTRFQWGRLKGMPTVSRAENYKVTSTFKGWMYDMFSRWRVDPAATYKFS